MHMMKKAELQEVLREGTQIIANLVNGAIGFQEFFQSYDNFYYVYGLDGDCSDEQRELLPEFTEAVALHREVQDAINLCYLDLTIDPEAYRLAGRLSSVETEQLIRSVVLPGRVDELLQRLSVPTTRS